MAAMLLCYQAALHSPDSCYPEFEYLNGTVPVTAQPLISFSRTYLSAITVTSIHNNTVVFLGTSDGKVKKVDV